MTRMMLHLGSALMAVSAGLFASLAQTPHLAQGTPIGDLTPALVQDSTDQSPTSSGSPIPSMATATIATSTVTTTNDSLQTPTSTQATATLTDTPSLAPAATTTAEAPTGTPQTSTPTLTGTPMEPEQTATSYLFQQVIINEVAWAGTLASPNDEWIELYNAGSVDVELRGWTLSDGGDIKISLSGTLPSNSFFLLERSDDSSVSDVAADQIYAGGLNNAGETLVLSDPNGALVDSANFAGGPWPAGEAGSHASMQRLGERDLPGSWASYPGPGGNGIDAAGSIIAGTPRRPNVFTTTYTTATPSLTATKTPSPTSNPLHGVLINEVAWAGTLASPHHEWIELYNATPVAVDLTGWTLSDASDIQISLAGTIPPQGFFLLERSSDSAVADIGADLLYGGALSNAGETLWLHDPSGALIDSANMVGGAWPAGRADSRASMERRGGQDTPGDWGTFSGNFGVGVDANGDPIPGTPHSPNSILLPSPTPSAVPGRVVLNEALIRPHFDWDRGGSADLGDEFIELYNLGPMPVNLLGWLLDDAAGSGSKPFSLPALTIQPHSYATFFRSQSRIALNDRGDVVRLLTPDGKVADLLRYLRVRAYNLSYGRLPDGSMHMAYGLWPTPGGRNLPFIEPGANAFVSLKPLSPFLCPEGGFPQPFLASLVRRPTIIRWLHGVGMTSCRR